MVNRAKFKMVIEVKEEEVVQKIHQNYRMTYIKVHIHLLDIINVYHYRRIMNDDVIGRDSITILG